LDDLGLDRVVNQAGGLDTERHWGEVLSLGEQQLLSCARLFLSNPSFAIFERPNTALSETQVQMILDGLVRRGVAYVTIGNGEDHGSSARYDYRLSLEDQGRWQWAAVDVPADANGPLQEPRPSQG
jgi:putative ATP-binding cassette transporter